MKRYEQMDKLMEEHDGVIKTDQIVAAGISKAFFYDYVKERKLELIAHGIYVLADAWINSRYLIHLPGKQTIFSHETALFIIKCFMERISLSQCKD
jgi:hypothetical protein